MAPPILIQSDVYRRAAYGANHPLAIPRVETATDLCAALGWLDGAVRQSPVASEATLARFHTPAYVAALKEADASRFVSTEVRKRHNIGTLENPVFAGVFERAATAVGGSILAAHSALDGHVAYHPAGGTHHAQPDSASGFCYFNDPVFAILTLLDRGLTRILYADLDAHHGDGVEDAFAADPRVFTLSLHEANRWPHSGAVESRRGGQARNFPVPSRFNDSELAFLLEEAIVPLAERFGPQAVVVTAGADPLAGDPLSTMQLSNQALWTAVTRVADIAPTRVILGGGGYNPWTLARFWTGLWGALNGFDLTGPLPQSAQAILSKLTCDLIDEDEVDPVWLTHLCDSSSPGPIRPEIRRLRDLALAP